VSPLRIPARPAQGDGNPKRLTAPKTEAGGERGMCEV